MKKNIICISCPLGCRLSVSMEAGKVTAVEGHSCKRGAEYGKTECENPVRTITTTVKVKDGSLRVLPVKTEKPIPKDKIFDFIKSVKTIEVSPTVNTGDILAEDVCGTGVNLVACRALT